MIVRISRKDHSKGEIIGITTSKIPANISSSYKELAALERSKRFSGGGRRAKVSVFGATIKEGDKEKNKITKKKA